MKDHIKIPKRMHFFESWFCLLLILFILKGCIWAIFITPPTLSTSADDIGHLSYIQYIYSQKKLPVLFETMMEDHSLALFRQYGDTQTVGQIHIQTESFDNDQLDNHIAQHPPLYYLVMVIPYALAKLITPKLSDIIIILRLVTLSTGVLSLLFVKRITSLLKLEDIVQKSILIFFSLSTSISFYFMTISNDGLLILLCLISLYYLLKYEKELTQKSFVLFCISSACVLMTKYTGGIVIAGYLIYFLIFSFNKNGVAKTFILCLQGLIIGGCICVPFFIRNYFLYGNPVQTYDDNSRLFAFTFATFISNGYIWELSRHIICLIGWGFLFIAPANILIVPACILATSVFFALKDHGQIYGKLFLIIETAIIGTNCVLQIEHLYYALIIFNVLVLIGHNVFFEKNIYLRKISRFFAFLVFFTVLIFGLQHYIIFCHRGHYGATHGRYYYIILFPFSFLIFRTVSRIPQRLHNIALAVEILLLMFFDFNMMHICLGGW